MWIKKASYCHASMHESLRALQIDTCTTDVKLVYLIVEDACPTAQECLYELKHLGPEKEAADIFLQWPPAPALNVCTLVHGVLVPS